MNIMKEGKGYLDVCLLSKLSKIPFLLKHANSNMYDVCLFYTRGVSKIMSSVLYFAEIVQLMHKTTSCRSHDTGKYLVHAFTGLAQCTSFHSLFVRLYTKRAENVLEIRAYIKDM